MKPLDDAKIFTIDVHYLGGGRAKFSKPEIYPDEYWVRHHEETGEAIVLIKRDPKAFPVYMEFRADVPLTAVGFAERGHGGVPKCTVAGCCGGCFFLVSSFNRRGSRHSRRHPGHREHYYSPMIQNLGDNPQCGYSFKLWTPGDGLDLEIGVGIDPQIYNQGDMPPEDGK